MTGLGGEMTGLGTGTATEQEKHGHSVIHGKVTVASDIGL